MYEPIPIILHCPICQKRHIDTGDYATKPHHTHACQRCGHIWRPAIVPTVGVRFLPGCKNLEEPPEEKDFWQWLCEQIPRPLLFESEWQLSDQKK